MRKLSILIFAVLFLFSCGTSSDIIKNEPQEIIVKVEAVEPTKLTVVDGQGEQTQRSIVVENPDGHLSNLSFIAGGRAFVKIFSGLSIADVTNLWNDFVYLENNTDIRDVSLFINSPGGDAFSGLALADQLERAQKKGFKVTAYASGIIASAAVPVFVVCDVRLAAPGTIFMVHEAALWKWPGRESASDIKAQNELMCLLRERYLEKLVDNSKLNKTRWEELEKKTTWFSAEKALKWGIVDRIE